MKSIAFDPAAPLTKKQIVHWYMNDVLNGNQPKTVYLFAKEHGMAEEDFYKYFNSFDSIERYFFELVYEETVSTMYQSEQYSAFDAREKMLTFYYTFFGNLTANRSFVLTLLSPSGIDSLKKLKGLRKRFLEYAATLDVEKINLRNRTLNAAQDSAMREAAWLQLATIIKFWLRDESPEFEKTDVFIEKSVNAGFELIHVRPLKSVADLGRFLFKEFNPVR